MGVEERTLHLHLRGGGLRAQFGRGADGRGIEIGPTATRIVRAMPVRAEANYRRKQIGKGRSHGRVVSSLLELRENVMFAVRPALTIRTRHFALEIERLSVRVKAEKP